MSCEVRVTVRCDRCGIEGRHTRLWPSVRLSVWEELLARVTSYLSPQGWMFRKAKDLCPECAQWKRDRDGADHDE